MTTALISLPLGTLIVAWSLPGYEHVYCYVMVTGVVTQQLPFFVQYGGHAALRNSRCWSKCQRHRDKKGKVKRYLKARVVFLDFNIDLTAFDR